MRPKDDPRLRAALLAVLTGAVILTSAAAFDALYLRHGFSATYYQTVDGERRVIDRVVEHRPEFPNVHRVLARYVEGWPFDLPIPRDVPRVDAVLRATITVPEGPPRTLHVNAVREASILVDREPAAGRAIEAGEHQLYIRWHAEPTAHPRGGRAGATASFRLSWGVGTTATDPVPASALRPADGPGAAPAWLWTFAILFALGFGAGVYLARIGATPRVRWRRASVLMSAALVLLGLGMRSYDYDVMPEYRENADELFATWNGYSLLEDGTTRGWSLWQDVYGTRITRADSSRFGDHHMVISPYFEHPPLLHVLVGAAAHLGGAPNFEAAKLEHTRLVPIALAALSTILLIAIGSRLWPRSAAPYLGAFLYSTLPMITLQTRVIKEEALLTPLLLLTVLFFLRWRDEEKTRDLVLAATFAGLGVLTKVPAAVLVPALGMLVAAERRGVRWLGLVAGIGLAVSALLLVYGAAIDWDNFIFAQQHQAGRAIHWNIFPRFFDETLINHNGVGRGWILFLWLGYAACAARRGFRDTAVLTVMPLVYLISIGVASGNWTYGWYVTPIYPFLCLGAGDAIAHEWKRPTVLGGFLLVGLLLFYSLNFYVVPSEVMLAVVWNRLRVWVTLAVVLFLTPFMLAQVWPHHRDALRAARASTAIALVITALACAYFVVRYDWIYETFSNFDQLDWFRS